ncbi:hypothetical protein GCM10023080_091910 [Streptomyces pseudoechinosporeus]
MFVDTRSQQYYALVPTSTSHLVVWQAGKVRDAECLGPYTFLGVPEPRLADPDALVRSYWCVPMDGPGTLCTAGAVSQLVMYGRYRQASEGAS